MVETTVRLGQCWIARTTKLETAVRLEDYSAKGGWTARSLSHGRRIWIRSAAQLIRRCDENGLHLVADGTEPNRRSQARPPEPTPVSEQKTLQVPEPFRTRVCPPEPVQAPTLLDAVVLVLREYRHGLSSKEIIEKVLEKGLWNPGGKTPWLTLHTALSREIESKGTASRFKKGKHRGQFLLR